MSKLFRKEAIDNNRQRMYGDVLLIQPISFWVFTISIVVIVIVILLFLIYGSFERRETVIGFLVPDKGVAKIYTPYGGIVESKNIIDGQIVNKGDLLIEITNSKGLNDDLSVNQQLLQTLTTRKDQLSGRILDESLVFDSDLKSLNLALQNINEELEQLENQLIVQQEQLKLAENQRDKYLGFKEKSLIVDAELIQKKNNYLTAKSNLDALKKTNHDKYHVI
jgi:membrane fusion protein